MAGKSVFKLRAITPLKRKMGGGGQKRGKALVKSEHPAAGRGAVQHSLLNKQAISGRQLEPFPPPSCSEHFFFLPSSFSTPKWGDTWERSRNYGSGFLREIREEGEGKSDAPFLSLPYCHFSTFSKKAHIIHPLRVIGSSSYRLNMSCSTATNYPRASLWLSLTHEHTHSITLQLQLETGPHMNESIDLTATPKSNSVNVCKYILIRHRASAHKKKVPPSSHCYILA